MDGVIVDNTAVQAGAFQLLFRDLGLIPTPASCSDLQRHADRRRQRVFAAIPKQLELHEPSASSCTARCAGTAAGTGLVGVFLQTAHPDRGLKSGSAQIGWLTLSFILFTWTAPVLILVVGRTM
jgi:hypothetical protein